MSQNAHWKGQLIEMYSSATIEVNSKWTDDSMLRNASSLGECSGCLVCEIESIYNSCWNDTFY